MDAEALLASQTTYQVDLIGPTTKDYRWQAREQHGSALTDFSIDGEQKQARCPQGQTRSSWTATRTRNQEVINIMFGSAACVCSQNGAPSLSVRRHKASVALEAARQREQTRECPERYAERTGVEGVHAQGVRRMGLRRSRSVGEPRTHLQHVATAAFAFCSFPGGDCLR